MRLAVKPRAALSGRLGGLTRGGGGGGGEWETGTRGGAEISRTEDRRKTWGSKTEGKIAPQEGRESAQPVNGSRHPGLKA